MAAHVSAEDGAAALTALTIAAAMNDGRSQWVP
jgi:hypothetical protein